MNQRSPELVRVEKSTNVDGKLFCVCGFRVALSNSDLGPNIARVSPALTELCSSPVDVMVTHNIYWSVDGDVRTHGRAVGF